MIVPVAASVEAAARRAAGDEGDQLAVPEDGGHAVDPGANGQGQAHEGQHVRSGGGLHHPNQGLFRSVQDHPVPEEIPAAGAGEGQLGKHQHLHAFFVRLADALDDALRVILAVGHLDDRGRRRDLDKTVFHSSILSKYALPSGGKAGSREAQGSSTGRVCM